MKGYFSRLIQQTGITFEPSGGSRSAGTKRASLKQRGKDVITPFHSEADALIHSEQNRVVEPISDHIAEDSESSYHISEHEAMHQPLEERHGTRIVQDSQSQMSGSEKSVLQVEKREQIRKNHTEMDLQLPSPDRRQKGSVTSDLIREGEGMIIVNQETKEDHVESGAGPFTPVHQQKNESAFKPVLKANEKISQAQTSKSYLREVREWVAAAQEDKQVELNNGDRVRVGDIKKSALTSIDENRGSIIDYYGQKASKKNDELEVNDFHLSIGTINLTIEEPRNEVLGKKPPQFKGEDGSKRLDGEYTRLSRHYIRIR